MRGGSQDDGKCSVGSHLAKISALSAYMVSDYNNPVAGQSFSCLLDFSR